MHVIDRIGGARGRMRGRWYEMRTRDLGRRAEALKSEVRELRAELDRERDERSKRVKAVRTRQRGSSLFRRLIRFGRVVAIAGGAYVLGSKAGRERYDQIRERAKQLGERVRSGNGASTAPGGTFAHLA